MTSKRCFADPARPASQSADQGESYCVVPRAWQGMSAVFAPERVPRICFTCADRPLAEALAAALELVPTHTLCRSCAAVPGAGALIPCAA